jgi:hypothetical protein
MPFDDSYANALRSRLQLIDSIGEEQTTWERISNARKRADAAQQQKLAQMRAQMDAYNRGNANSQSISNGLVQAPAPGSSSSGGDRGFNSFVNSIGQKESSGRYGAVNRYSGALGKYQIMPANINGRNRGWDYEALGHDVSTSQFLSSPEIQEKVARYKLQQYYNKYGPAGASIAWYAGPGAANRYIKTGKASTNTQAWGFPSIASYMQSITGSMF